MIDKTLHRKLNVEQHEPKQILGLTQVLRKGKLYLFHNWHPSSYSCYKPADMIIVQNQVMLYKHIFTTIIVFQFICLNVVSIKKTIDI